MREIHRTFDTLSIDGHQTGYILLDNSETLELQYYSLYSDDPDTVAFLEPTEDFNAKSTWNDALLDDLVSAMASGAVTTKGTYSPDDNNLPQYRYSYANRLVTYGVKIDSVVRDKFRDACNKNSETQSEVITRLMNDYVENV